MKPNEKRNGNLAPSGPSLQSPSLPTPSFSLAAPTPVVFPTSGRFNPSPNLRLSSPGIRQQQPRPSSGQQTSGLTLTFAIFDEQALISLAYNKIYSPSLAYTSSLSSSLSLTDNSTHRSSFRSRPNPTQPNRQA